MNQNHSGDPQQESRNVLATHTRNDNPPFENETVLSLSKTSLNVYKTAMTPRSL